MFDIASTAILESPLLWTLLALQIAMGGFDVVFHHELTERLAWKTNAANELRLHAWRNVFYGFLFTLFAWVQPHGLIAVALIGILLVEIIITLWDFVEEDRTRALPASERVLHTLLAINYGAILALVLPLLVVWSGQPTSIELVSYGWGSAILTIAGLGCTLFAVRDFFTSARARGFVAAAPEPVGDFLDDSHQVLVTGGSGFVGRHLVSSLVAGGHDVTVLTRDTKAAAGLPAPVRLVTSLEQIDRKDHFSAVVDLAGEPVAGGLWTTARKREIMLSRLRMSRSINQLIERLETKPTVLITASAIGAYGITGDEILTEADAGSLGPAFTRRVCRARERVAFRARGQGVRVVGLRIGLVLDRDGGFLANMIPAFDLGLGGPIGNGGHWMSWIALPDLVRLIAFSIATPQLQGAINATAPEPVRNADFAAALGRALYRPAILPVPGWPLEIALGDFARELLLGGQRVVPEKAMAAGFKFRAPSIDQGLELALRLSGDVRDDGRADISLAAGEHRMGTL
ncbi:MAG: TIGR01777 family oxidoreductase [Alphaproteobacteria bacterium]|nr:TIGR01777 family oxidoreductase [Alphaproteobacteria bacterium]